jgi:hypothetical protein
VSFVRDVVHLVGQVEDVRVVERHVMTVTAKDDEVLLEDDARVAVARRGSLALDMVDLGVCETPSAAHHGRLPVVEAHGTAHGLSLAHLVVVLVEVRRVVVLDQE